MRPFILYSLHFPNGKLYFGVSNNLERRWAEHKKLAAAGSWFPIHAALRKYGSDNVLIRPLVVGSRPFIQAMEIAAISVFQTRMRKFGYNVAKGGETSPMHSPEVAAQVAATKRGRQMSQATLVGWQIWFANNRSTWRQKLSEIHKARWAAMSMEERRTHLENRGFVLGREPSNKGKKVTDLALRNIRAAVANRGAEWLAKVTAANQQQEFTAAKAAQLAAARQNVDHAKRTAASVVGNRANWADPEKRKIRIAKLKATWAAKRQGIS